MMPEEVERRLKEKNSVFVDKGERRWFKKGPKLTLSSKC
jgi:hypothetical protein